jgi:hypothetical protein
VNRSESADFDLHGLAGVRVVDASERDRGAVARQLGSLTGRLDREPDITIRFVDRLVPASRLHILGAREAGWADDGFYVLTSRRQPVMIRLPIADVGRRCEIVVQRGAPAVPYLIAILNMTVLANGGLPLHAAAFELDGRGVLVTGWSKGGKTELLMAATGAGARYIGDEWVYLTADGAMHGIAEPVRLWDWHLDQLPAVRSGLGRGDRLRLRALRIPGGAERRLPATIRGRSAGRTLRRAVSVIDERRRVDVPAARLFGDPGAMSGRVDHVLFVVAAAGDAITTEPIDPLEVARRMASSLAYERQDLRSLLLEARFAFPDLENAFLDDVDRLQAERLAAFLAGRPAHRIVHPYPVDFGALLDAARSVL